MSVGISDRGGTIDGNALVNFSVIDDITVQGVDDTNFPGNAAATWQILNDDGPPGGGVVSPFGGTIHGSATLLVSATNLTLSAGSLDASILNRNAGVSGPGGTIDSDANITFNLSGDLITQNGASFLILNQLQPGGTTGGTIGADAAISVTADALSTASLQAQINNMGGSIGGDSNITFTIGGDLEAASIDALINNRNGGSIGAGANITFLN